MPNKWMRKDLFVSMHVPAENDHYVRSQVPTIRSTTSLDHSTVKAVHMCAPGLFLIRQWEYTYST